MVCNDVAVTFHTCYDKQRDVILHNDVSVAS